jgi:hypothetical protein
MLSRHAMNEENYARARDVKHNTIVPRDAKITESYTVSVP